MKHLSSICAARARLRFCRGALLVLLWFMATPCLLAQSSVLGSFRADDLAFSQSPVNTPGPNRSPQPHGAAGSQGLLSATNYRLSYWSKTTDPQNAVRRWSIPLAREVAGPASQAFFQVNVTDARVLWEPVSRRFIVVAMRRNGPDTVMHLAASTVEDPAIAPDTNNRAQWRFTSFSTRTSAENYPVIAASDFHCGVDAANLCVVASLAQVTEGPPGTWTLGYTQGARTFAVDRQKVLAGQSSTPRTYSYGLLFGEGSFGFSGERGAMAGPRTAFSQANRTFGASYEKDYDVFGDDHYLRLHVYDDLTGSFRHDHDDIEIDTVYPSNPDPLPDGSDPPALEHHVVDALTVRSDGTEKVWVALHQAEEYRPVPGGFAAAGPGRVRVLRVDVNGSSSGLAFDHFFKLGAEEDFYCAGLSANAAGDVCVAFVGSEATQYPRTYYSIIRPDGTVEPMTALDAPTANASGGFVWGPTISISPDPDDGTFWIYHQSADPGETAWHTRWTQVSPYPIRITRQPPTGAPFNSDVDLDDSLVTFTGSLGAPVVLSADVAGGTGPLGFRWFKNGQEMTGTGHARFSQQALPGGGAGGRGLLTLTTGQYSDEGDYQVHARELAFPNLVLKSRTVRLQFHPFPEWSVIHRQEAVSNLPDTPLIYAGAAMAYDARRKVSVLFGGDAYFKQPNGQFTRTYSNQTWEWDGRTWRKISLPVAPSPRQGHSLTYDPVQRKLLLFGGSYPSAGGLAYLQDLWEYDGATWRELTPSPIPPSWPSARANHSACFDSARGRLLLIGGSGVSVPLLGGDKEDFWLWDGPTGTWSTQPKLAPYLLGGQRHGFVYDEARQVAVLFGPHGVPSQSTPNLVLEWNGAGWTAGPPATTTGPFVARADGAVWDPWKKECLVFSTNGTGGDVGAYYWNGRRFQRAVPSVGGNYYGTYFRGESVPFDSRFAFSNLPLACDTQRRTLVHHGSVLTSPNVSLTTELRFVDRPEFFRPVPPIFVTGANPTLVLSPLSTGANRYGIAAPPVALTFQWFRNGVPLVDGGRISGATSPTLTITGMTGPDYGLYRLEVRDPSGHIISSEAQVGPSLTQGQVLSVAGRTPGLGFTIAWEAANVRLERSTTLQTWTPVPGVVSPYTIQFSDDPSAFFRLVPGP